MEKHIKKRLTQIIFAVVLLIIALVVTNLFELNFYIEVILFVMPYSVIGYKVLEKAIRNIFRGQIFDENFLMAIASLGAMILGEFTEAVAVMLFYQVGELFEKIAVGKSRRSISELMDIAPDFANKFIDGNWVEIDLDEVEIGDRLLVKVGQRIPVDGAVLSGNSSLNMTALTGESLPIDVGTGEKLISGSINICAPIEMVAESEYENSTVAKILELVENSSSKKSKAEQFIKKFARYYTPTVVILALIIGVIPPIFVGDWSGYLYRAIMFLVVSCPCALVISVPLSFFAGIGSASAKGVLIKGSNYMETLANANYFLMDKTGTITKGSFSVVKINSKKIEKEKFKQIVASIEQYSDHPIAKSIVKSFDVKLIESSCEEISGKGMMGVIENVKYYVGNAKLMSEIVKDFTPVNEIGTVIYLATESELLGELVVADTVKESSFVAMEWFGKNKYKTVMLTGDNEAVAKSVAVEVGIDEYHSELLPQDKVSYIDNLMNTKNPKDVIAFCGDGINDAPSLMRADIGIAMGGIGSGVAIESADIVLMKDDLSSIIKAKKIANKTMSIVKQNIIFSLAIKFGVLLLTTIGMGNIWYAVFADVGVTIIAVLNALRSFRN